MSASLSEKYEEKVRPYIDLIDSLRPLGVEKDLALPAIAVIGDQSSGKSSVLEALSGVPLPRGGEGIVTRCPLELKMKKSRQKDFWHGKIKYKDIERNIADPADVERSIRKAQNEIAGALGMSDELIRLEVTSTNAPDLTFIDLPGIVRVPVKGQPEDIEEQIKSLMKKFITKQDTIILVVVPCNVDITTTEALKMAQKIDLLGERTIGILTKPDLVEKGKEDEVVSVINNDIIFLTKGYTVVRCQGQQEVVDRISLYEAIEKEKHFFIEHPHFRMPYKAGKATIPKLAENLTLELVLHIEKSLPQLKEQIQLMLAETQTELDRYNSGPPTDPEQWMDFLTDKITAFTQDAIKITIGEETKSVPHVNIFSTLRREFNDWKTDLDKRGKTFNKGIEKEVKEYEEKYRGRELPGFINYKTFEIILKDQIKQLEKPAIRRMKDISDFIRNEFIQLAQSNFPDFPNLLKLTKTKIENIKQLKESEAESMLNTQFNMELMIYTQDSVYTNILNMLKHMEEEDERQSHGMARPPCNSLYNRSDTEATLEDLTHYLKSYYSIASNHLADQVPLVIKYKVLQESAEQLQREMLQLMQNYNINDLLEEDHYINIKRNNLKSRQKRLAEALVKLVLF
ncbi:interferon-induced GTP-binding protein Mx1-like isoform X1 [Ictalurus punctatus]|uniref:Interferon-induced GTP-binding protein Mx1-like isoform X1 n=1 Tax=Ictalurus punctatus TaxID=7998 RepID=A0A2D0T601_ICTPU|nr:interferon-induced GTP-binding protein Mx1-like isoform X1 [Ictalurus punctatus]